MSIWCVTNLKPGTAKTTSAVWLAHALHETGRKVLLVGADPGGARLKLAPELSDGMGSAERWNARAPMPFEVISLATRDLHRTLPRLAADYDDAVIDSPPIEDHQGIAVSALRVADVAIIPVAPTTFEIDRMAPVLTVVDEVNTLRAKPLPTCVLLNRCVTNAASTGEAAAVLAAQGHTVLATRVPRLELYAQSHGAPVVAAGTAYAQAAVEIRALLGQASA
ncbi:ParA family protein [Microbispora sp. H10949]|uniref:ParA family protein n=1 Tax=Microbispora sp. H10949 TaxID=2729111 RepID=UPI001600F74A|nr:ParA family protein [Microbispora sp. H10949]